MLEAVASYDLWIWHAYFGPAGSNNDINILNQSDLFNELLQDRAPPCNFSVSGCNFNKGYYLTDGIYPDWATLVKSFKSPPGPKSAKFKKYQESARKDIERAFGVLQDNGHAMCSLEENYKLARRPNRSIEERVQAHMCINKELRDSSIHHLLRQKLIEHIWNLPANFRVRHVPHARAAPEAGTSNTAEDVEENEDESEDESDDENENEDVDLDEDDA
ncbi:uncharacterized protein [Rutidosis leptorrhynchoides]|uniref:uncharacterized protein n=1 Tax=Rutidosis leptorrhynchoides TaxID=125765 RepID=UPI003A9A53AA